MRWRLLIVGVVVLLGAATLAGSGQRAAAATGSPLYAFNSGLVLTGGAGASGNRVTVAADQTGAGQRWLLETDGTIRLSGDTSICLDVPAFNYASGVQLDVYTCKGSANQQFTRTAPSASSPVQAIKPTAHSSLCLNVKGGLTAGAGAAVILYACGAATTNYINEAWSTTNLAGSTAQLPSANGFPLNASAGGGAGAAAVAWPDSGTLNEYWQTSTLAVTGFGVERVFQPIYNTSLCLSPKGGETLRAAIVLAACTGVATEAFAAVSVSTSGNAATYFIVANDAHYCLNYQGGAAQGHAAILFTCVGTGGNDTWVTNLPLATQLSEQFGILGQNGYANSTPGQLVLDLGGTGSGASVLLDAPLRYSASAVWTDLPPGGLAGSTSTHLGGTPDNPDGSISLHPLSDLSLCLTVPGATYAAGQHLDVETCNGGQDQEFFRLTSPVRADFEELLPYADGQLCLSAPPTAEPSSRVELDNCDAQGDQAWSNFSFEWGDWGGRGTTISAYPPDSTDPAPVLTESGIDSVVTLPPSTGDAAQAWHFSGQPPPGGPAEPIVFLGYGDLCLGPAGGGGVAGTAIITEACDGSLHQSFIEKTVSNASYAQLDWGGDTSLCLAQGPSGSGQSVILAACSATDTSEWWQLSP